MGKMGFVDKAYIFLDFLGDIDFASPCSIEILKTAKYFFYLPNFLTGFLFVGH